MKEKVFELGLHEIKWRKNNLIKLQLFSRDTIYLIFKGFGLLVPVDAPNYSLVTNNKRLDSSSRSIIFKSSFCKTRGAKEEKS